MDFAHFSFPAQGAGKEEMCEFDSGAGRGENRRGLARPPKRAYAMSLQPIC